MQAHVGDDISTLRVCSTIATGRRTARSSSMRMKQPDYVATRERSMNNAFSATGALGCAVLCSRSLRAAAMAPSRHARRGAGRPARCGIKPRSEHERGHLGRMVAAGVGSGRAAATIAPRGQRRLHARSSLQPMHGLNSNDHQLRIVVVITCVLTLAPAGHDPCGPQPRANHRLTSPRQPERSAHNRVTSVASCHKNVDLGCSSSHT